MKKIILIGEFSLNIVTDALGQPLGTMPGGRIAHAAAMLARKGIPAVIVGDCSADKGGDIATSFLAEAGVDTSCLDRYTDGLTPVMIRFCGEGEACDVIRYEKYPQDRFDVAWPRIDAGDIVVFGGYEALDPTVRPRMLQLLQTASDMKATLVYLPGFLPSRAPRITRVMPSILENLEMSRMVITRTADLRHIFNTADPARAFRDNVAFYCPAMLNIDAEKAEFSFHTASGTATAASAGPCGSTLAVAGATAGALKWLFESVADTSALASLTPSQKEEALAAATALAAEATATAAPWQLSF